MKLLVDMNLSPRWADVGPSVIQLRAADLSARHIIAGVVDVLHER